MTMDGGERLPSSCSTLLSVLLMPVLDVIVSSDLRKELQYAERAGEGRILNDHGSSLTRKREAGVVGYTPHLPR